jgi:regulator of sirC expression with transglutaminase-like and TPR domain
MSLVDIEIFNRLKSVGDQNGTLDNIAEVALLLAQISSRENGLKRYYDELELISLNMDQASLGVNTLVDQIKSLHRVIYTQHGYHGDIESYNDTQNANLMRVIDRRKGLPVALGILVIHAARSQGWNIAGLNFPGHFLLRLSKLGEHAIINPFDDARLMLVDELNQLLKGVYGSNIKLSREFIKTVSDRDILVRLQNNIKTRALQEGDRKRAIEVLVSMNLIVPINIDILSELALLESDQGNYQRAIKRLELFLERNLKALDRVRIMALKDKLIQNLN